MTAASRWRCWSEQHNYDTDDDKDRQVDNNGNDGDDNNKDIITLK